MPKLSVIIPVYNVAPHVGGTLDSVVAAAERLGDFEPCRGGIPAAPEAGTPRENGPLVEVICVDDGSTDGSGATLDAYVARVEGGGFEPCRGGIPAAPDAKSISFRVLHQPNAGVSAARNAALDLATGEWVMMLDGDDTWEPDLLVKLFAEIAAHPDCDAVGFGGVKVDASGAVCGKFGEDCPVTTISGDGLLAAGRSPISHFIWSSCDKIYRRSIIERNHLRYVDGIRIGEDSLFAQSYFAVAGNVYLDNSIKGYRCLVREGSATATTSTASLEDTLSIFLHLLELWERLRTPGLLCRLRLNAAGVPFSHATVGDSMREQVVCRLVESRDFNRRVIPFLVWHGRWKSRAFAIIYFFAPACLRVKLLRMLKVK